MKTKLLLFFIFCLTQTFNVRSQVIEKDIIERVNHSPYIFEGEVIRVNCYFNTAQNYIYTSITVDIKKIFKGDLSCGTVELILLGGQVNGKSLEISHNLALSKKERGIFLCQKTKRELPVIDYYHESNEIVLQPTYGQQGFVKFNFDGINPEVIDYWQFHLDSVAQAYDLMELYTQLNYKDCYQPFQPNHHQVNKSNNIGDHFQQSSIFSTDTNILVTLENQQVVHTMSKDYFEFDISLSDSCNGIYFIGGNFKFKYDTLTFGSRIKRNGKITLSRGLLTQNITTYDSIYTSDYADDIFGVWIKWANYHTNPVNFIPLTNNPINTLHVKIEIDNCNQSSSIIPIDSLSRSTHIDLPNQSSSSGVYYTNIQFTGNLNFSGCASMYITSILPNPVTAGTGDSVIIIGKGFGNIRGNGNVFLPNADQGGSYFVHLDSIDYLPNGWSDTLIKFILPSVVDSVGKKYCPGSGLVKIKVNGGDSIANPSDIINVSFAVKNIMTNPNDTTGPLSKFFVNLTPKNGAFIFRPDTSFTNHADRLACLETAIKQWVCLTTVNFQLGPQIIANDSMARLDTTNIVQVGDANDSTNTIIAFSQQWTTYRRGSCNSAFTREIDLVVNREYLPKFVADTTPTVNIPAGKIDLYNILLHELGHAHSIGHVNDRSSIMWWSTDTTQLIPAANRRIKLYTDLTAINAGSWVINKSILLDTSQCTGLWHITSGSTNCSLIGISEIDRPEINLNVYPNPASENITLSYELSKPANVTIQLIDLYGRPLIFLSEKFPSGVCTKEFSIGDISNGIYLLRIAIGNFDYAARIIKQ